ncbi:MAG TPA: hypothetical protein VFA12_09320 [Stellaceae bacterium]|nr:hypothetical protein [Stellaceae bacterium]
MAAFIKMSAVALAALAALGACTPRIPVKDDFVTSALIPKGETPPEFADFDRYNPAVAAQLADQLCATPDTPLEDKRLAARPGQIVALRSRCQTHVPIVGSWPPTDLP